MKNKPLLTVFTPSFNRADLLPRGYEALKRQTSQNFEWLIIDDGSVDDTREVVSKWINEGIITIKYVYKSNGGLHTGYNKAIEIMDTELCVCIDSDDWMPDNAVEIIENYWNIHKNENIVGFVGKDFLPDGTQLGADFPEDAIMDLIQIKQEKKWNRDHKPVMKVELLKKIAPQPTFNNEKNFNPYYLMLKLNQFGPYRFINKNLCFVDYQGTGMSTNIMRQYFNSPNSFVELRRLYITLNHTKLKWRIRQYIHIVAESKIAQKSPFNLKGINNFCILFFYPIGIMLYYYMIMKRNSFKKVAKTKNTSI